MSNFEYPLPQQKTSFFSSVLATIYDAKQTANQDFERFWNKYFSKVSTSSTSDENQDIVLPFKKRKMSFWDDELSPNLMPRKKFRKKYKKRSTSSQISSSRYPLCYSSDSSFSTSPQPIFYDRRLSTPKKYNSSPFTVLTKTTASPRVTRELPSYIALTETNLTSNDSSPVRTISSLKPEKKLSLKSLHDECLTPSKIRLIVDNEIDRRMDYLENKIRELQFRIDEYSFSITHV